jgi:DNA (cytosine-5)-methyltransferase 1
MEEAIKAGALSWRPEPVVRMRTEEPRALDLFCGAGGTARGLQEAGYHVTGVDIRSQPRYVGDRFVQADAMAIDWTGYDLIWASPPCQAYTPLRALQKDKEYPDLIAPVRKRLIETGTPWIMENVPGAPMHYYITLCGSMFGLRTYRHRRFETSHMLFQPPHPRHVVKTSTKKRRACWDAGLNISVTGDVGTYVGRLAMGIDWMTGAELSQAIPPAYSRFLGTTMMELT